MNCTTAQGKIVDAAASRVSRLPEDLHQHVRECGRCRAFFASQASLATAVDSHLRLIANEAVPPSLLPGVRARIEHEPVSRHWIFGWQFATLAAAVVLLVALGIRTLRSDSSGRAPRAVAQVAPKSPIVNRPVSPHIEQPAPKASRLVAASVRKTNVRAHSSASEVLVLPEEQQVFRRFVSHISQDQDSARALVAVAPGSTDAPVEIALLAITNVEVKPLEGTDSE